jgi:hypothetical protein
MAPFRLIAVLNGREHLTELRQMLNVESRERFAAEDAPTRFSNHLRTSRFEMRVDGSSSPREATWMITSAPQGRSR